MSLEAILSDALVLFFNSVISQLASYICHQKNSESEYEKYRLAWNTEIEILRQGHEKERLAWYAEKKTLQEAHKKDRLAWNTEKKALQQENEQDRFTRNTEMEILLQEHEKARLAWSKEKKTLQEENEKDRLAWNTEMEILLQGFGDQMNLHGDKPSGWFYIVSEMNGKVLDICAENPNPGARVIVWPKKKFPPNNQLWYFGPEGIIHSAFNGLVIETKGGTQAKMVFYTHDKSQQWIFDDGKIISKNGECLENVDEINVISSEYKATAKQHWRIEFV